MNYKQLLRRRPSLYRKLIMIVFMCMAPTVLVGAVRDVNGEACVWVAADTAALLGLERELLEFKSSQGLIISKTAMTVYSLSAQQQQSLNKALAQLLQAYADLMAKQAQLHVAQGVYRLQFSGLKGQMAGPLQVWNTSLKQILNQQQMEILQYVNFPIQKDWILDDVQAVQVLLEEKRSRFETMYNLLVQGADGRSSSSSSEASPQYHFYKYLCKRVKSK